MEGVKKIIAIIPSLSIDLFNLLWFYPPSAPAFDSKGKGSWEKLPLLKADLEKQGRGEISPLDSPLRVIDLLLKKIQFISSFWKGEFSWK